jgi:hypothetical protein
LVQPTGDIRNRDGFFVFEDIAEQHDCVADIHAFSGAITQPADYRDITFGVQAMPTLGTLGTRYPVAPFPSPERIWWHGSLERHRLRVEYRRKR